jgi:AcrR family transcriptional regulator
MLHAAMEVFAEKGFDNSTLDEIAERAEFGKGTVYNYFPEGKEGLLFAIFEHIHSDLLEIARTELSFDPDHPIHFRQRLSGLIISLINHFLDHNEIFTILQKEGNRLGFSNDAHKAALIHSQHQSWITVLEPVVTAAMDRGELRKLPPRAAVRMILGSVEGFLRYRSFEQCSGSEGAGATTPCFSPEEAADILTSLLMDGIGASENVPVPDMSQAVLQSN